MSRRAQDVYIGAMLGMGSGPMEGVNIRLWSCDSGDGNDASVNDYDVEGGLYTPPPIPIGIHGIPRTVLGFRSEFTRIFFWWVSCQFGIPSLSKFLVSSDWNARNS